MKNLLLALSLLTFTILFSTPVKITSWQIKEDVKRLNDLNVSIDYVNTETQTIIAYTRNEQEYNLLVSSGFTAEVIPNLAKEYAMQLWDETKESNDPLRAYYSITEYHTFMQNTAIQFPNICQLVQFGSSIQNRPLYFLKISDNVSVQENEPEVRLISSIHGDEVVGFDLLIRLIQLLTAQYGTNPRITDIVNSTELWICPMLNPDGYVAASRFNANGADLNRNFPGPNGIQHPDGMAWQPETLAVMNHGNSNSINLSANFHGGALVANYPWDYTYTLAPDNDLFIQLALTYSINNTSMYNSPYFPQGITNGAQWYIVNGGLQDWVYAYNGAFDITIEVSDIKWPNASTLDSYWNLNQESILSYIEAVQKGIHGTVTNAMGQPLDATIQINTPGIDIKTDPDVGDYHRMLLPGTYTLTAISSGYQSSSVTLYLPDNTSLIHNFVLNPISYSSYVGTVIDLNGIPISNVSIDMSFNTYNYQTQTDANGQFFFDSVPEEVFNIKLIKESFGIYSNQIDVAAQSGNNIFVLPAPVFYDDFEAGLGNWTVQSPWGIVNQNGDNVLTDSPAGNYGNNVNNSARLTNPINLANYSNQILSFDIKYALENNYDYLYVQGSNNGTSWQTLTQFTGTQQNWEKVILDISNYATNFYLRFRLISDYSLNLDGVYIDNVMISGLSQVQTVYGDTDSNWIINLKDIQNILEYSVGLNPIPAIDSYPWQAFRIEAADVDNDGLITATDAYYIYNRLENYESPFPVQTGLVYPFVDPGLSITASQNSVYVNFNDQNNLRAMTLTFSSDDNIEFSELIWNPANQNIITSANLSTNTVSVLCKEDADIVSNLLILNSNNISEVTHCNGLVNNLPVNLDIQITNLDNVVVTPILTQLMTNYPNPFNPETHIRFSLTKAYTKVKIDIFNAKGQLVRKLLNKELNDGFHSVLFDGRDDNNLILSHGIYYYRMTTPEYTKTRKMVMIK